MSRELAHYLYRGAIGGCCPHRAGRVIAQLRDVLKEKNIPYRTDVKTATLCTIRIGGPAALVVEPRCRGELIDVLLLCARTKTPFAVLGRGSNILFDDGEIDTVLIRTTALDAVQVFPWGIRAQCGVTLAALAHRAARAGLGGLAFAAGIPGTLGGAVFMNAGAHGAALGDLLKSVTVFDPDTLETRTLFSDQLNVCYRKSRFQAKNEVILSADLLLTPDCHPQEILGEIRRILSERATKQPLDLPSAGSAFRRPAPDIFLSKWIDECGLKGLRVGDAAVSQKHAGFIVNLGSATAADVHELIKMIQNIIEKEKGIRPMPEIRFFPDQR